VTTAPPAREFARLALAFVVPMVVTWQTQRLVLARIDPATRSRGWAPATWGLAVLWFGPLAMIPFFWVLRRRRGAREAARALALGIASAAALLAACTAIDAAIAWALGVA
jgi:hypothetical protein